MARILFAILIAIFPFFIVSAAVQTINYEVHIGGVTVDGDKDHKNKSELDEEIVIETEANNSDDIVITLPGGFDLDSEEDVDYAVGPYSKMFDDLPDYLISYYENHYKKLQNHNENSDSEWKIKIAWLVDITHMPKVNQVFIHG